MNSLYLFIANAIFVFAIQGHARNFKGSSQKFLLAMNLVITIGTIACTAFFFIHGYKVSWLDVIGAFILSFIAGVFIPSNFVLSSIGLIAVPVLSVLMFIW